MMRKLLLVAMLLGYAVTLVGCGGGNAASSSAPIGVNPGLPSIVQLLTVQQIVHTNSTAYLKAKVLDGNGVPVPGVEVIFTNLSRLGTLNTTMAKTDAIGFATSGLFSTTSGAATIQAEVNIGSGIVRSRTMVFFTSLDLPFVQVTPTLALDADSNNNGIFDEPADMTLFKTANDNQSLIRATVRSGSFAVVNEKVTFNADSTEVDFPTLTKGTNGWEAFTDTNGRVSALMVINPATLRNISTTLNVSAVGASGEFNAISFFLNPVVVSSVSLTASPNPVASAGTASLNAVVTTSLGTPVPDGTLVNFTAQAGGVTPVATTSGGLATASWTAPTLLAGGSDQSFTVTASVGGRSGNVLIGVTAPAAPPVTPPTPVPLAVTPPSLTVVNTAARVTTFNITGGTGPYTVVSSNPLKACNDATPANQLCNDPLDSGLWTSVGSSFTVTIPSGVATGTVTLTVTDSAAPVNTATVTITIM